MSFGRCVWAVDSHTAGEPTRVVVGGLPAIPGSSMAEKKRYLSEEMDWLRRMLMWEPRGHRDMFGSVLTSPCEEGADLGIVFMDGGGYLDMCGHGTIGAATVAVEMGLVRAREPETVVRFDTPAGLVEARVRVEGGRAVEVSVVNVPSFLYRGGVSVEVEGVGEVTVDVAFGGNFFAVVDSDELGLRLVPEEASRLVEVGLRIREAVDAAVRAVHPERPHLEGVRLVEFSGHPLNPAAHRRNAVVFGDGQLDRSPCGTGTSAKMAVLHARGELGVGEDFVHESVLGTLFRGRILGRTRVGPFEAVIPQITGRAHITGFCQFVLDPQDPLGEGFRLG